MRKSRFLYFYKNIGYNILQFFVSAEHLQAIKYRLFCQGLVFTLPIFLARPRIVLAVKTCRWHVLGKKKPQSFD